MTQNLILIACAIAVVASGLVAGVFLTFSDFVMRSLAAAKPASGIEAMQVINRKVTGSVFLVLLLGMAALSLLLAGFAAFQLPGSAAAWIIAGGAIYLLGVFLVTLVCNVPMNRRLDAMDHNAAETATYWVTYASSWTRWNHVRTVASAGSTICFLIGCALIV